jgi:hypothetical protein
VDEYFSIDLPKGRAFSDLVAHSAMVFTLAM